MFALLGPVCACAPFDLGFKKFQTIFFADLSRANDPQSCYESAEQDWADSSKPAKFWHFGALPAYALPPT